MVSLSHVHTDPEKLAKKNDSPSRKGTYWWTEYFLEDRRGLFLDHWRGSAGTCSTNVRVYRVKCTRPEKGGDVKRSKPKKVPCSVSSGEGARRDLSCWIGTLGSQYLHRLAAFVFLNTRKLTWSQFNRANADGSHRWVVDHTNCDPRFIDLDHLEIVDMQTNRKRYRDLWWQHVRYSPGYSGLPQSVKQRPAAHM